MTDTQRQLVEANLDLVPMLAKSVGFGPDTEYAESDGYIALTQAVQRFNPDHATGASFRTFAGQRIRGAVMDSIRAQRRARGWLRGGSNHVTRRALSFVSMELRSGEDGRPIDPPDPSLGPLELAIDAEHRARLFACAGLTTRERHVLRRLLEGQDQDQIAREMVCSQSLVSVLKKRAVATVRAFLASVLALAVLALPLLASAQDIPTRTRAAATVVVARVTDVRSYFDTNAFGDRLIVSRADLLVQETLKGTHAAILTVVVDGGTVEGVTLTVSHLPSLRVGDRAVFFLDAKHRGHGILKLDATDRSDGLPLSVIKTHVRGVK